MVVLPDFLERSEVFFDGVEVWRIRRKEEQDCAFGLDQLSCFV